MAGAQLARSRLLCSSLCLSASVLEVLWVIIIICDLFHHHHLCHNLHLGCGRSSIHIIIMSSSSLPLQEVNALIYSVLPVLWHSGQSLITIAMFVPCLNMQLLPERVTVCLCLCIFVNMQLIPGRHSCCLIVFVFFLTCH